MPRKKANIHYLYKTTCLITGRYYIGMHSIINLEDGYMGSGKRLGYSIKKYGKENHIKEILEFFDSRELLIEAENKTITLDMLCDKMCMNLCVGGNGWNLNHNKAFAEKLKNNVIFKENYSKKMSEVNKKSYAEFESRKKFVCDWTDKRHSDTTKAKMREVKSGTGLGEQNSQFNTCWVTLNGENKKIKKSELKYYLSNSWTNGRFTNICGENIKHSKLKLSDIFEIKKMLTEGVKQKIIAVVFNVAQETISKINRGLIWKSTTNNSNQDSDQTSPQGLERNDP